MFLKFPLEKSRKHLFYSFLFLQARSSLHQRSRSQDPDTLILNQIYEAAAVAAQNNQPISQPPSLLQLQSTPVQVWPIKQFYSVRSL